MVMFSTRRRYPTVMLSTFWLIMVCLGPIIGCGSSVEPTLGVEGVYTLTAINNGSLPQAIVSQPPEVWQITGARLSIAMNGSFTDSTFWRVITTSINGEPSVREFPTALAGTWTRAIDTLRLTAATDIYIITMQPDGSLNRYVPRQNLLGGPYLDLNYRYERR
jgi:hypothetical protein